MIVKQLSIFVENKSGRLCDITELFKNAGIDIRALSIADTTDYGILRVIVNKTAEAEKALKENGLYLFGDRGHCRSRSRRAGRA